MRMTKERVHMLATAATERLQARGLLDVTGSSTRLVDGLVKAMDEELSVETRLDDEIRTLLKQYDEEFQSRRSDYQRTFEMVKNKLVKDRGLVL